MKFRSSFLLGPWKIVLIEKNVLKGVLRIVIFYYSPSLCVVECVCVCVCVCAPAHFTACLNRARNSVCAPYVLVSPGLWNRPLTNPALARATGEQHAPLVIGHKVVEIKRFVLSVSPRQVNDL